MNNFNFQPASDFYFSQREKGKNHEEAFQESLDKFNLHIPGRRGKFRELIDSELDIKKWKEEQSKELKRSTPSPAPINEELTAKSILPEEEKEDKMEPWHKGAYRH